MAAEGEAVPRTPFEPPPAARNRRWEVPRSAPEGAGAGRPGPRCRPAGPRPSTTAPRPPRPPRPPRHLRSP
ncbi:MAG TPA: hypothetical protein DIT48_04480 [Actinobacteria bacterium]|nr:hypothetical protein [Actinomycetota bacterium]